MRTAKLVSWGLQQPIPCRYFGERPAAQRTRHSTDLPSHSRGEMIMNIPDLQLLVFAAWTQLGSFQASIVSPWSGSSPIQLEQSVRKVHMLKQAVIFASIRSVFPNISL